MSTQPLMERRAPSSRKKPAARQTRTSWDESDAEVAAIGRARLPNPRAEAVIWQYWETRGEEPRFIDGLHEIARRNSGVRIVLVTPQTLREYLPDIEDEIFLIEDLAHKADMIRSRLVCRYGGMWLDSDAVVLGDLNSLFDHLKDHAFVGFNDAGRLQWERPWVRVCCFLSRPQGAIISRWVDAQRAKLSQTKFRWAEIGAEMLNAACLEHRDGLKILPFEDICPIGAKQVENFMTMDDSRAAQIIRDCPVVMVSNRSAQLKGLPLSQMSVEEIAAGDYVLSRIMRRALDPGCNEIPGADDDIPNRTVEVDTPYGRIEAFDDDYITQQIRKFGAHTRPDIAFLRSVVEPGDFVFDLGAHIGTFAIPLAQKIGAKGKLLAVEGNAETFEVLERNLGAATLESDITALNALVAQTGRRYAVNMVAGNSGGAYFTPVEMGGVSTEVVTVDALCARFFTPRVIKLDIEGGEFSALSAAELLKRAPPILYVEINNKALRLQGASIEKMERLLRDCGYRFFRNIGKRHAAHDNFIVAELMSLPLDLNNFDILAVHAQDPRLDRMMKSHSKRSLNTPGENIRANRQKWDRDHPWPEDGDEWNGQAMDCNVPYREWKQSLIDHLIAPFVIPDMHVLEIAPGHGRWTEALVTRARKVTAVDLSQNCLDFCQARFAGKNTDFFLTDGASLPPGLTQSIDFLWSFDAFVHMAPGVVESYLKEIARVLKPGASATIHHSDIGNVAAYEQRNSPGWRSAVDAAMVRGFAEAAGLQVVSQIGYWDEARKIGVPRHNDKITTVRKV